MKNQRHHEVIPTIDAEQWLVLASEHYAVLRPDLDFKDDWQVCSWLGSQILLAHRSTVNEELLWHMYVFVRWSMIHVASESVRRGLAAEVFEEILRDEYAKARCVDYLDLSDVRRLMEFWDDLTQLEDEENFQRLYAIWERRWSRNQKLPAPTIKEL